MKTRSLLLVAGLLAGAFFLAVANWQRPPGRPWLAPLVPAELPPAEPLPTKSHHRDVVSHRIATATIAEIDRDWGFVVLNLERGTVETGRLGYLDQWNDNRGFLRVESILEDQAIATGVDLDLSLVAKGDLILFSPDLLQVTSQDFVNFSQVLWVSE